MTPTEHSQMNTALIILTLAVVGALTQIVTAGGKSIVKMIDDRQNRLGLKVENLANGEGDAKIEKKVKEMIADGHLTPGPASLLSRNPASLQRSTDSTNTIEGKTK